MVPCVSELGGRPMCLDPGRYQWVGSAASEEGVMRLILLSVKKSGTGICWVNTDENSKQKKEEP